ncbi:MAG: hypothetical protein PHD97_13140 [Bacteroidales bacterium]|nr:hypothetical protein [Bacteroidales bacterium]
MSRKDYVLIADTLNLVQSKLNSGALTSSEFENIVNELCDKLYENNNNFNYQRFLNKVYGK